MAVQTITYGDKQYLNQNADIPATNKVQDTDMNEIKSVVNNNANELQNVQTKNIIHAELSSNQTISNNYVAINYNPTNQQGNGLTLSNGTITINSNNINNLIISAGLRTSDWNSTNMYFRILKNNVEYINVLQNTSNLMRTMFIPVELNDTITIQAYCESQKTFQSTANTYNFMNVTGF